MRTRAATPALAAAALLHAAAAGAQQTPTMPSTLRYGSGLLDIPVSAVLPHLEVRGTYSGFWLSLDRTAEVDATGNTAAYGPSLHRFSSDASLAVGLFDRMETGVSLQSFGSPSDGGNVWGLFGRVRLWEPIDQGVGLAVGGRYVHGPDFGDGVDYSPGRLGFPDRRLVESYTGGTNFTWYGVATAYLRGFDGGPIPKNDMTFSLGYGTGMFKEGEKLDFYRPGHANGWFYGTSFHVQTSPGTLLTLMAEQNGFDFNIGAQFDWQGFKLGAHWLGSNHGEPAGGYSSEYHQPKLGLLASVALCPTRRGLRCTPHGMRRTEPDTIFIPPPPPDTVVINAGAAPVLPEGQTVSVCLSTGRNVDLLVTAQGDTLVGPGGAPLDQLRPALDFAGSYAAGAFWFENGDPVTFEDLTYGKFPDTFAVDCNQVLRVGVYQGVPVYADRAADRPLVVLFIPVRPGVWQRYERGIR